MQGKAEEVPIPLISFESIDALDMHSFMISQQISQYRTGSCSDHPGLLVIMGYSLKEYDRILASSSIIQALAPPVP